MSPAAAHKPAMFLGCCFFFVLIGFPPEQNAWCEPASELFSFSLSPFPDRYNLNITKSTCQKGKGAWRANTGTNLTQIYKNMPLELYQQLRIVGALFTEKRGIIYQYLQQHRRLSHTGARRRQGCRTRPWQQDEPDAKAKQAMSYFVPFVSVLVRFFRVRWIHPNCWKCEQDAAMNSHKAIWGPECHIWRQTNRLNDWSYRAPKVHSENRENNGDQRWRATCSSAQPPPMIGNFAGPLLARRHADVNWAVHFNTNLETELAEG